MLRPLILSLMLASAPAAALAAGGKKAAPEDTGPYVDLAAVGVPIVSGGRVVNYVFVQARLNVGRGQDSLKLRGYEPYYRDALVRAAHRTPFVDPNNLNAVDAPRLKAVLLAEGRRISGAKAFSGAEIRVQAPRRHLPPARKTASR